MLTGGLGTLTGSTRFSMPPQLEEHAESLDWQNDTPKRDGTPPIILRGFVRRADGIGAHLPNLYDKIFNDYKSVSAEIPRSRLQFNHDFFKSVTNTEPESLSKYEADFKWVMKLRDLEKRHLRNPGEFNHNKVIDVGGWAPSIGHAYHENFADFKQFKQAFKSEIILYLMWESTGLRKIKEVFQLYDKVVVTNKWLEGELKKVLDPTCHHSIYCVEHVASYYDKPASGGNPEEFTFGTSGGLWERKCIPQAVKAFDKVKGKKDIFNIHSRSSANTAPMVQEFKDQIRDSSDQVNLDVRTLPDKEFAEWWDNLNCYVFISAGESYSITPRQALMQGTPVILSKNTSHLDLLDVPGIIWVECEEKQTAKYSGNANFGEDVGGQFEPIQSEVENAMIEVKENYEHWKAEAKKGGDIIREKVNPERIKKQWDQILNPQV